MIELMDCPICRGEFGICQKAYTPRDADGFQCTGCGTFEVARSALVSWLDGRRDLSPLQRAAISHALRTASRGSAPLLVTIDWLERFLRDARLPTPAQQSANLIRAVGDLVAKTGEGYFIDEYVDAPLVGSINRAMFSQLFAQLRDKGLLVRLAERHTLANYRGDGVLSGSLWGLSLEGWERYEAERRGTITSRTGFIAMKFEDPILDPFVDTHLKPAIKGRIDYDLVDLRDVSRAGVIDNILREQIRDAAFVLVDLTHDNAGAYWEAGYAEGLGKPVIYICEKSKFDVAKTHFDTNHSTTVMWTAEEPDRFIDQLMATVRRSLNLFPEASS